MATEELVTEQFQFLGIDVQKEVLARCVSLCEEYNVDPETFTEQWMAFSINQLSGALPSLEHLDLLEKKEFSKRSAGKPNALNDVTSNAGSTLKVYSTISSTTLQPDNDALINYMAATPKKMKVEPIEQVLDNVNELGPATYSPHIEKSGTYSSRSNQGSVVHSYGDEKLLNEMVNPSGMTDNMLELNISQVPNDDGELYTDAKFGFELLHEKATIYDNHIQYLSQCIMQKLGITESAPVRQKTQTEVVVVGRIECDADARLNPKSVILQGTWEESLRHSVPVDLDNLKQYSLFPGQVVVMRGVNPRGDRFVAHEVYSDAARPLTDPKADMINSLKGTMSLVFASGPYTTSNNLTYAPLKDLVTYINTHKPHVVLLTGPFLDSDHVKVKDNSMAETFKSFFDKLIDSLADIANTSPFTKIYIVSSMKDAFHVNVYPTPPYPSRRKHPNIQFLPDPCTLNINGVVVGVTSEDVLMQISQEEISLNAGGDKMSRAARHVAAQRGWAARAGAGADAALLAAHAHLPAAPHALLLPSRLRYFAKEVDGCVVVNPEHLTKGAGGGTFARILLNGEGDWPKGVAVQIVRI